VQIYSLFGKRSVKGAAVAKGRKRSKGAEIRGSKIAEETRLLGLGPAAAAQGGIAHHTKGEKNASQGTQGSYVLKATGVVRERRVNIGGGWGRIPLKDRRCSLRGRTRLAERRLAATSHREAGKRVEATFWGECLYWINLLLMAGAITKRKTMKEKRKDALPACKKARKNAGEGEEEEQGKL